MWCENLQEVFFVAFFNATYPLRHWTPPPPMSDERVLAFLPVCPWAENTAGTVTNYTVARNRLQPDPRDQEAMDFSYLASVEAILTRVSEEQCFFVASHQAIQPGWQNRLRLCRALLMDKTFSGATQDVVIPYSCHLQGGAAPPIANRSLLLMGSGKLKRYGMFDQVRSKLFKSFANMMRPDVDARSNWPYDAYKRGFFTAKFCLVLPGDSMSSQQSSRAVLSGCVPVYVVNEERDLFAYSLLEYAQFSVVIHVHEALRLHGAQHLVDRLERLVTNGGYQILRRNVQLARRFFDFGQTGPCSPYGAVLAQLAPPDLRGHAQRPAEAQALRERRELAKLVKEATRAADESQARWVREKDKWVKAVPGHCGSTNATHGRAPCSKWSKLRSASWDPASAKRIDGLRACAERCRMCWLCHYVSYSREEDICSWYASCDWPLQAAGRGETYQTVKVIKGLAKQKYIKYS